MEINYIAKATFQFKKEIEKSSKTWLIDKNWCAHISISIINITKCTFAQKLWTCPTCFPSLFCSQEKGIKEVFPSCPQNT